MNGSGTIVLFAGTSEGRRLAQACAAAGRETLVCVATEYGERILPEHPALHVHQGRLDEPAMLAFLQDAHASCVVDATHPHAIRVSDTIRRVCGRLDLRCIRLLREQETALPSDPRIHVVGDAAQAARLAQQMSGNIFLTTGAKELPVFAEEITDKERFFLRVLPVQEALAACADCGVSGKHVIAMQGAFTAELNRAMYDYADAKILVTKESGAAGGFLAKLTPALERGMECIVIQRPAERGCSYDEVCAMLGLPDTATVQEVRQENQTPSDGRLYLIGIGMGTKRHMTVEACELLRSAGVIFGAERMLAAVQDYPAEKVCEYRSAGITEYLAAHPELTRAAVVFSGDVGFYSGADGFSREFVCGGRRWQTTRIAGISSVNYLAARLGVNWQQQKLCSVHGRTQDLCGSIRREKQVFTLLNGGAQLREAADALCAQGLGAVRLSVGMRLGYEDEVLWQGTVRDYADAPTDGALCVALFENNGAQPYASGNYADAEYVRGKVPLTKEEIRAVALSKLRLTDGAVCCDIGAGTGGMTCDMARAIPHGTVYAYERSAEGCALIRENAEKMGLSNLVICEGEAPEVLTELPEATHAFIGGSGGRLREIVDCLLQKNPHMRIVINAVTLETVAQAQELMKELPIKDADIASVTVAKAKTVGNNRLMEGMNPVYVFSFTGAGEAEGACDGRTEKDR